MFWLPYVKQMDPGLVATFATVMQLSTMCYYLFRPELSSGLDAEFQASSCRTGPLA